MLVAGRNWKFGAPVEEVAPLIELLIEHLTTRAVDELAHRTLPQVQWWICKFLPFDRGLAKIADWFIARAGAGDAALIANFLDAQYIEGGQDERFPNWAIRIALWLLKNGSAELRSARRLHLLRRMLLSAAEAVPDQLEPILRHLVRVTQNNLLFQPDANAVWKAMETMLGHGGAAALVGDAVAIAKPALRPLILPQEFPMCRDAILRALVRGLLPDDVEQWAWPLALASEFPANLGLAFPTAEVLDRPFRHIDGCRHRVEHVAYQFGVKLTKEPDPRSDWIRFLTKEVVRIHGALWRHDNEEQRKRLGNIALWPWGAGVGEALSESLAAPRLGDGLELAAAILAEGTDPPRSRAAVLALPSRNPLVAVQPSAGEELEELRAHLEESISGAWVEEESYGIDPIELFGGARQVVFARLADEDKVGIEGELLRIVPDYLEQVAAKYSGRERFAHATLYVFHELNILALVGDHWNRAT